MRRQFLAVVRLSGLVAILALAACSNSSVRDQSPTSPSAPPVPGPDGPLSVTIDIRNEPCLADGAGFSTCTFVASDAHLPIAPFQTYTWRFTNPANNLAEQYSAPFVSPRLECRLSSGARTFDVSVRLSIFSLTTYTTTVVTRAVTITRPPGACGT